jgi:hypothetical protein
MRAPGKFKLLRLVLVLVEHQVGEKAQLRLLPD